jgi:acyl-CoA reductase-like NAD-dependent aldehyde dehydrogenase
VNNYHRNVVGTPFGGVKHSGYGREHSIDTLREWCSVKVRVENLRDYDG